MREQLHEDVEKERDKLPLTFLFESALRGKGQTDYMAKRALENVTKIIQRILLRKRQQERQQQGSTWQSSPIIPRSSPTPQLRFRNNNNEPMLQSPTIPVNVLEDHVPLETIERYEDDRETPLMNL